MFHCVHNIVLRCCVGVFGYLAWQPRSSQEQHDAAAATADIGSSLDLTKADFGLGLPNPNKLEDLESAVRRWYVDRVDVVP